MEGENYREIEEEDWIKWRGWEGNKDVRGGAGRQDEIWIQLAQDHVQWRLWY
jgi:hypothetical protein